MMFSEVFDHLCSEAPVPVMVRATLQNVLSEERVNRLFVETAERQKEGELLFSVIVDLMSMAVTKVRPSINAAYQSRGDEIEVAIKSVYSKLAGVESEVSRQLVVQTARDMAEIIDQTGGKLPPLVPGFSTKILDGNHLSSTERRLKELRHKNVAPRPGHTLVVLDRERMLVVDAFPCEDGHAQERSHLHEVLETVQAGDLWVGDRNFCTMEFLGGVADRGAGFIIREHGTLAQYELVGRRRRVGTSETGTVYEQWIRLLPKGAEPWLVRRITVKLNQPTRDGDSEIHLLTNLPEKIDALQVAEAYRKRWTLETAFQEIEATLQNELKTLAYPKAALFGFCIALVSYNIMSVIKASLRAVHGAEKTQNEVSGFYLADEVRGMWRGLTVLLPAKFWEERFATQTPAQLARFLVSQAKRIPLDRFRKHPRGPKKKPPKMNKKYRRHASTARILAASRR